MCPVSARHLLALHNRGAESTCELRDNALIIGRLFQTVTIKTLGSAFEHV